jgi:lysophospholipase L1-like esterase
MPVLRQFLSVTLLLLSMAPAFAFDFKDGDRVVLIGSTLIEREQRYGYWEAELTSRYPDKNITFRNLGWSGDTVWGEGRAGFDSIAEGYKRLVDHVRAEKPTVIIVGYGTNESFAGPEDLPRFEQQLKKLLDVDRRRELARIGRSRETGKELDAICARHREGSQAPNLHLFEFLIVPSAVAN